MIWSSQVCHYSHQQSPLPNMPVSASLTFPASFFWSSTCPPLPLTATLSWEATYFSLLSQETKSKPSGLAKTAGKDPWMAQEHESEVEKRQRGDSLPFLSFPNSRSTKAFTFGQLNHYPYTYTIHIAALLISSLRHSKKTMWNSSFPNYFPFFLFKARRKAYRRGWMSEP